ncbi:sugar ABC transporter ATP-binding protein [Oscillospiraceae bacterium MB08-C2-2]|nr:sugar ABC transporter ATP-binding protein [Oscillospiraceae bacterium MB08-C2-2]
MENKREPTPILQVKNITKLFPGARALSDVSIDFYPGEAHALVGENGAGKSTLVKIISGVYTPTEGSIVYDGQERQFKNPRQALDEGISIIHQELSIANHLTVAENIFLGMEPHKGMLLSRREMNQKAQEVLDGMGAKLEATSLAGSLSAAQQQLIEIAKIIVKNSRIVIMDEPTSSLSDSEIFALFRQIEILKQNHVAIIYITHRMKELPVVCARVTVLRDGQKVRTMLLSETTEAEIVGSMVGRELKDYYNKKEHTPGKEMLRVENLTVSGVFSDISFTAYAGEILGIAGLVGAKRTDVLESIFAARQPDAGQVFLEGQPVKLRSPKEAIESGLGFVTEDRRSTGLMLKAKIKDNVSLPSLLRTAKRMAGLSFINTKWEKEITTEYYKKLKVRAPGIYTEVSHLSGGNQQKIILAKWLVAQSKILLLDEPTRGIDVNAKSEFYSLMNEFVEQGGCIVMVSSELPEILGVSDRILVMREGRISGELSREEANEYSVIQLSSLHSGS